MPELRWILLITGAVILLSIYWWGRRSSRAASRNDTHHHARSEPPMGTDEPMAVQRARMEPELRDEAPWQEDLTQPLPTNERLADPFPADEPWESEAEPPVRLTDDRREPIVSSDFEADAAVTTHSPAHNEAAAERADEQLVAREPPEPALAASERRNAPRKPMPRKIVVLRLAAGPNRISGAKLREAFAAEGLQFGKYEIFHRVHSDGTHLFSVASMVEPGSFDPHRMEQIQYPGVTLFAQLPAPVAGLPLFEDMLACAKNLQTALGGALQDERGAVINTPRLARMRQEITDFEALVAQAEAPAG